MLTEKDIQNQLQKDMLDFYSAPFEEELPDYLIDIFRRAIFCVPPVRHQIHVIKIKEILSKEVSDLLVGEVGMIMKTITEGEPSKVYESLDHFLDVFETLEKIYIKYNSDVAEFNKRQERKRDSLYKISSNGRNGMKILRN